MTIRVFIADDQALVRAGLAMVVDAQEDMRVVGESADGQDALNQLTAIAADVVLMDVRMPRLNGIEATQRLIATPGSTIRVLVLTTFDLDEYAFAALRAGASGFLLKDARPAELLAAIRAVHAGDAAIAPSTTRRLIDLVAADLPAASSGPDPLEVLTSREVDILMQVASGASNAEIAGRLFLAEATVKTHVGRVLGKLGLRDRVQAVVWAYEHRIVLPGRRDDGTPGEIPLR